MMSNSPGFPQLRRLLGSFQYRDSVAISEQATPPTIERGRSIINQHVSRRLVTSTAIAASIGAMMKIDHAQGKASAEQVGPSADQDLMHLAAQFEKQQTAYRALKEDVTAHFARSRKRMALRKTYLDQS
jgi:hypothetical protein